MSYTSNLFADNLASRNVFPLLNVVIIRFFLAAETSHFRQTIAIIRTFLMKIFLSKIINANIICYPIYNSYICYPIYNCKAYLLFICCWNELFYQAYNYNYHAEITRNI